MSAMHETLARLSLRSRIALLAAVAVGLAVAVASVAAYLTVRSQTYDQRDEDLLNRARSVAQNPTLTTINITQTPPALLGAADIRMALVTAVGQVSFAEDSAPPLDAPELAVARGARDLSMRTASLDGVEYRVVTVPASGRGFALVLAQPTGPTEDLLDRLGLVLFLVGAAGIAVAAWAGLAIARAGLRPVERLTAAVEHVAATERLAPIEVRGHDELARLASSFNSMLAALQASRDRQQQLVADAGHELRTPLTSLRTNLDLLAQSIDAGERGLPVAERDALVADVRAQIEELTGLVQDLVELARDDAPTALAEDIDFADICERAVDRVRRRAPGLTFDVELAPWSVRGDATGLERAVTNILDNSAKWSPPAGKISVRLERGELTVADDGPGIADEDLPHIFDRFYRSSDARRLPGSGLGLAIVKQVAERHGGVVSAATASGGGTVVTFRLPLHPRLSG